MQLKDLLRGTGVAIITPFDKEGEVDFHALGNLIEYIIGNGVEYIVSLGTTGETPVLNRQEKIDIIDFTTRTIDKRVPLVIGVAGNNTRAVIEDLQHFPLAGADAILSASPYYNRPSQEGIYQHYEAIAKESPKPIILYNVPARTGRNMTAETTLRLAHHVENIAGIKEASGDLVQCMKILKDAPTHFAVISGDDALALPQIACGMTGLISVAANAFPATMSAMVQSALASDFLKSKAINDSLMDAYDLMFEENNPAGVKAVLTEMKIIQNYLRLPGIPVSGNLQMRINDLIASNPDLH